MKIYRIALPTDVVDVGQFMSKQSDDDRQIYFGCSISPEAVVSLYTKISKDLQSQTVVVVKELSGNIVGFIHLAHTKEGRIELGIYVSPSNRQEGIGGNLLAIAMLYTFSLMGKDMEMQCVNRNYDIQRLISKYEKEVQIYSGEQVAIIPNTVENQRRAITRVGRAMWNF